MLNFGTIFSIGIGTCREAEELEGGHGQVFNSSFSIFEFS